MNGDEQTRSDAGVEPDAAGVVPGAADPDEALRSLERLRALTGGAALPRVLPVRSSRRSPPPRPASGPRSTQAWARIAAPVAFLAAVIVVVSVAFQSGVVGEGRTKPTPAAEATKTASARASGSPKASASPATGAGATRSYTVKPGDTLSGIAVRFDTTVAVLEDLNRDADLTTLQPGQKLIVPRE